MILKRWEKYLFIAFDFEIYWPILLAFCERIYIVEVGTKVQVIIFCFKDTPPLLLILELLNHLLLVHLYSQIICPISLIIIILWLLLANPLCWSHNNQQNTYLLVSTLVIVHFLVNNSSHYSLHRYSDIPPFFSLK